MGSRDRSLLVTATLVVAVALLVVLRDPEQSGSDDRVEIDDIASTSSGTDAARSADLRRTAPGPPPESGETIEAQIRRMYGRDAAGILRAAKEAGVDLDATDPVPTWEELRDEAERHFRVGEKERSTLMRNYLSWPDAVDARYLRNLDPRVPEDAIDESVLRAVELLAEPHNAELERESARVVDMIAAAKAEMFDSPHTAKMPFANPDEAPGREGDTLYAGGGTIGVWRFNYVIYSSDAPGILEAKAEVRMLQKARQAEIREYLATLR